MPFDRPTLTELRDRARADINARLPGADSLLRRSNLDVIATTHAGAIHGLYGFIDFVSRQVIIDTAEVEFLDRWATVWGVNRIPAILASGNADVTGADGSEIPAGTTLARGDGVEYVTTALATIAAGVATVPIEAVVAGADSDMATGTALTFSTPVAGVDSTATAQETTGGGDTETDAALRARLLDRIRQPPHGGADFDYVRWALETSGLGDGGATRAWVFPLELGIGTVTVRFVMDDHPTSIIPDAAAVAAVQAHIDSVRPITSDVTVVAPVPVELDLTITPSPDTAAVRAAITAELSDMLRRDAVPGGTILISHIREAISIAAGENDYVMPTPVADITHAAGEIAVLGSITWPS